MFDKQSVKLVELQKIHGIKHGYKDDLFADWTGDTGFHLTKTITDREVGVALALLRMHNQQKENPDD